MASVHPEHSFTVIPSLAASDADRVFISSTSHNDILFNAHKYNALGISIQDIFPIHNIEKLKKEVHRIDMKLQHCKSLQYNMKLPSRSKFFNN